MILLKHNREFGEDGRVAMNSWKHHESVSPHRQQLHRQNLSDVTNFETLESVEGFQLAV